MSTSKRVTKIPATLSQFTAESIDNPKKRRVAAYARVSTDHEEQVTSYKAQINYYTKYIKERADWEFAGMYTDEGISGTSTKHREGFKRMIADALNGKIDLIISKSVSRFARNTVDSLSTIRKLKENKVECYFEKENIWTFDAKGELLLTIMASLAQEESRSISENCTWGHRKRFADGKFSIPFSHFLGYDRGPDGNLVVNPEQAKLVRRIYGMFLGGMSINYIANKLTSEGIPTPSYSKKWNSSCIGSILSNEKYKGDALLQKSYTVDYLTQKRARNKGQLPQYYVRESHEAIIPPATFDLVQSILASRASGRSRVNWVSIFSGKIRCGCCGGWYGPKPWNSGTKYKKIVWQCNHKYDGKKCTSPTLSEANLKEIFLQTANRIITQKYRIIETYRSVILPKLSTTELEKQRTELIAENETIAAQIDNAIKENARVALDQAEYEVRYNALMERSKKAKGRLSEIEALITEKHARRQQIELYLNRLKTRKLLTEFRKEDWFSMVDHVTAYSKDKICVTFIDGTEIQA